MDAFGHVSARDPENRDHFLLSRSRSPLFVEAEDIISHDFDGNPLAGPEIRPYAERILHAQIYQARPDVMAICHNHALPLLPFTTSAIELKPICHSGCLFYEGVPVYDDYDVSDGMLIINKREGERIARAIGSKRALLLRGHGAVVVGSNLKEVVMGSIYLALNAHIQYQAIQLGQPKYLSYEEGRAATEKMLSDLVLDRAWEYWQRRTALKHSPK